MDEIASDIETELSQLRLRRPSDSLLFELERELASSNGTTRRSELDVRANPTRWIGLGLAAALLLTATSLILGRRNLSAVPSIREAAALGSVVPTMVQLSPTGQGGGKNYEPVSAANVLYDLRDEGPIGGVADSSYRQVRYRYVDTYTWKNPRKNASLSWSVPRDEIRIIPASLN